jgi:hypothetical protein
MKQLDELEAEVLGKQSKNNSDAWRAGVRYAIQRVREEIEVWYPMIPELVHTCEMCDECNYPRLRPDLIAKS